MSDTNPSDTPSQGDAGRPAPGSPAPPPIHTERRHRAVGWQTRDVMRAAALVIALYLLVRLLWFAHPLFLTAFLGVLFGLAVASGADRLERFHIPRGIGAALIVIAFAGSLTGFGAWMAPTLREQGTELRRKMPQAVDRLEGWIDEHRGGVVGLILGNLARESRSDSVRGTVAPRPTAAPTPPASAPGRDTSLARSDSAVLANPELARGDTLGATLGQRPPGAEGETPPSASLKERLGEQFSGATRYLFPFLSSTIAAVAGILLIIFMAIYIGSEPDLYRRGIMQLFPHRSRDRAGEVLTAMATMLRKWLVTQLIAMAAIGVVTTTVLLILDVEAAFALGVLAGLLEFVPTVGPIISAVPAIAMGFLDSPEKAMYVGIAYIGIQFLENHLLIPLLMKGSVNLPPALTILSQALMAILFGFLGLMCAVPLLAASMVAIQMLYVEDVVGEPAFAPEVDLDGDD